MYQIMKTEKHSDKMRQRAHFMRRRHAINRERANELSSQITERLLKLNEVDSATIVHSYVDSLRNEVATRTLIMKLLCLKKRVVVPVVSDSRPPLLHAEITNLDQLSPGPLGIEQPSSGSKLPVVDVVIVPALTFDRAGNRLGMGGGFYDEMLRTVQQPTIGIIYDELIAESVPTEPQDVTVDIVLTERNIYRIHGKEN
tara:strand:+ start:176 stop:772 length:597 start_codon:yes stop_codon:yes gene_type:complete